MTKVYPNYSRSDSSCSDSLSSVGEKTVMTVWRKSLLFNCKGFTVFDAKGNLLYRVENYSAACDGEIVLMDAYGKSLFTIRRKRLSLGENWLIYHGEEAVKPHFSVKKHVTFLPSRGLAHVTSRGLGCRPSYSIEGSYSKRRCTIYDGRRCPAVEVQHKEAASGVSFGGDVFRLTVLPGFDAPLAMAMVIVLEQMFR